MGRRRTVFAFEGISSGLAAFAPSPLAKGYIRRMPAAIDSSAFRDACSRFATGVSVVTSSGAAGPSGMTANAVASLSLDPPLMVVCFALTARTLQAVQHSGRFGVHFLSHDQEDVAARFASKLPEAEKFDGLDWEERDGVPALGGCLAGLACQVRELLPGGDHLVGVGEVTGLWRDEGEPLLFYRGSYWSLSEREDAPPEVDAALEGPGP
jgi:3-hydroxy-9,10-secoandrosta-1,3,5(10)-triene-9,17-dione monooxygenase reductase component